ncbi:MAG: MBL fold metallo-hydrolase [Alphaproteobacteria bacterium]|mgnify:CR=1|jgi:glyoxylase-like metal-dependent hydrolase (beta-lactamase superfamily II)|nr:MBL fold metallo-hydrolase [Rhodospirillaceae bacterium]MBT6509196.1 MBL fold metallo-hydrolase [Rhodospirillaceae bacterium]MBT7615117.1 MBL fold metallo-hydrolase [Rhodospirillaceae bacterium]MBT7648760.1 MBL fold metallo-hydrolase [Rhodospirillaceae bacterium]MDG2480070.1 MBL fold metallo-hydrolase [Alphaproteobacteria bacterium]
MKLEIGDIRIDRIEESCDISNLPHEDFPDATPEALAPYLEWLKPAAIDPATGRIIMPVQTYLVRTRHHTILLDTCVGNHKHHPDMPLWNQRDNYRLLEDIAAAGVRPEDIDFVMCSHLHLDHAGWNTQLIDGRWVPTFPNAKYLFCQEELDFAQEEGRKGDSVYGESVQPVLEAGLGEVVAMDFALDDNIMLEPTPGHTPGHVATHLVSQGKRAVMSGDLIHSPFQLPHPEWSPVYDWDRAMGATTRRRFLESLADTDTLMMSQHFPAPSTGHVFSKGDGFGFRYLGCDMVHG